MVGPTPPQVGDAVELFEQYDQCEFVLQREGG